MSFELKLADARVLKTLIRAVQDEVELAPLAIYADRLELSVMDAARSILVYFILPKQIFETYVFQEKDPAILALNFKHLWEQVFRSAEDEPIMLRNESAALQVILEGPPERCFTIPLIDKELEPPYSRPELDFTCKVILGTKGFQQIIQTLDRVGEAVEIQTHPTHGLQFVTYGDGVTKAEIILPPGQDPTHHHDGYEHPAKAIYSLALFKSIPKHLVKHGERVNLAFGHDLPLMITIQLVDGGELGYLVAPRITEES